MVRQFVAVALILLTLASALAADVFQAATTTRVAMQSEADQLILASFLKHADGAAARLTPEAVAKIEQVEDICWIWSRYAEMPLVAFELTGDAKYLDSFVKGMESLLTRLNRGPDGILGFRGLPLPLFRDKDNPTAQIEVDISEFEVVHLICRFVEQVDAAPSLKHIHGDSAARLLDIAENHLAGQKWEERELFMDLGTRGAVFRMPAECGNDRDHLTNPHNKQSKMCRAYLALYRVTGKDAYFRKAIQLGARFKHMLRLDGEYYRWNYWDPAGDWDRRNDNPEQWKHWIGPEHRSGYHALTVAMAAALYDHGVVFNRTDMQRFVNTQMQVCWNGSLESPVFRNTGGKPMDAAMVAPALARFEPLVWEFCYGQRASLERLKRRDHPWQGGVNSIDYLTGKYLVSRTAEPTRARYRQQFTQNPENAAFLKQIESKFE